MWNSKRDVHQTRFYLHFLLWLKIDLETKNRRLYLCWCICICIQWRINQQCVRLHKRSFFEWHTTRIQREKIKAKTPRNYSQRIRGIWIAYYMSHWTQRPKKCPLKYLCQQTKFVNSSHVRLKTMWRVPCSQRPNQTERKKKCLPHKISFKWIQYANAR